MKQRLIRHNGMTILELIVAIILIGILGAASIGLLRDFIRTMFYLPNQGQLSVAAREILEAVVDGSPASAPRLLGLRFTKKPPASIGSTSIKLAAAKEVQFFTDGLCEADVARCLVRLRLDEASHRLMRSYRTSRSPTEVFSSEELLPYYAAEGLQTYGVGSGGVLFSYFDSAGNPTADLTAITRVDIAALIQTGSGSFDSGEGSLSVLTSVAVRFR